MLQRSTKALISGAFVLVLLALVGGIVSATPAQASGPDQKPTLLPPSSRIFGVVPTHDRSGQAPEAAKRQASTNNLIYHTGPAMRTNVTYAIYWIPSGYSVSSGYVNLINGFFKNVAADSGKTSNVYYSDTQYKGSSGSIAYKSTFGGFVIDTNPYPANGCTDPYTTVCLSDAQIAAEIQTVMAAKGWTTGLTHLFFMFTPKNVGSCASGYCAYTAYCAYHNWIGSGSSSIIYANQPYGSFVAAACDIGQHPNGDDADATINLISHEHNESITDPLGTGWWDRNGYENGDKCAWNFGTARGSTATGLYNQVINGSKYYLQQEWSNSTSRCVLTGK
jgi:hypothetical protein